MFPSLTLSTIEATIRRHNSQEDAVVSALLEEVERKGGVSSAVVAPPSPAAPPRLSVSPLPPRHVKVAVPSHGNVPDYFDSFWAKHGKEFAPLTKADASKALFFDKHFTETSEAEGTEEILNVLRKLKRRSLH